MLPGTMKGCAANLSTTLSILATVNQWVTLSEHTRVNSSDRQRTQELAERLGLKELSMGMSGDFEQAVSEGATIVRIGEAIFRGRGVTT